MGYQTDFYLSEPKSLTGDQTEYLLEISDWLTHWEVTELTTGFAVSGNWFNHEIEMKKLSKKFPDTLFCLEGIGEETDDRWKHYFRGGKSFYTRAELKFEEYSDNKLQ